MSFVQNAQFLDCISVKRIKNCNLFEQKILLLNRKINKARYILRKGLICMVSSLQLSVPKKQRISSQLQHLEPENARQVFHGAIKNNHSRKTHYFFACGVREVWV